MTPWITALLVARLLDTTSSCTIFARGGQELTPWMPNNCRGMIAVQSGLSISQAWAFTDLAKTHPTRAKWLAALSIAVEGTAVAWNLRQLHRHGS